jgi:Transcriptional regulators
MTSKGTRSATPARRRRPSVGLFIETATAYGRGVISGIASYVRTHGSWSMFLELGGNVLPTSDWLLKWKGDGIICRLVNPDFVAAVRRRRLPIVDLNDDIGFRGLPHIGSDMREIGRAAADHLLDRGFRNIAFCGYSDMAWSRGRREGVEAAVRERGVLCGALETERFHRRNRGWQHERDRLAAWVESLPRPVGIVACNDVKGCQVLDAIRGRDIIVPEEVAVIGVDDDPACCAIASPPLSSVQPNAVRIGYEAAALLDRLMAGRKPPKRPMLIPPLGVVTRQSTDVVAVPDPLVARALDLIREHACEGWNVDTIVAELRTHRAILERRFRRFVGFSPHEQIRRVRLGRVKQLLLETDWTLERIAEAAGYERPEYLTVQFTRIVGERPSKWRARYRAIR